MNQFGIHSSVQVTSSRKKIITHLQNYPYKSSHNVQPISLHTDGQDQLRPIIIAKSHTQPRLIRYLGFPSPNYKQSLIPIKKNILFEDLLQNKLKVDQKSYRISPVKRETQKLKIYKPSQQIFPKISKQPFKIQALQITIPEQDIVQQTIRMLKGLKQNDLLAFILLVQQSQRKRAKQALMEWDHFSFSQLAQLLDSS